MLELAFLEVGVHPKVVRRDDRDEIGAAGDIGADLSGAIADIAIDRRANIGVAEIEFRRVKIGLGLDRRRPWRRRSQRPEPSSCCFEASRPASDETTLASAARLSDEARSAFCRDPAAVCARSR